MFVCMVAVMFVCTVALMFVDSLLYCKLPVVADTYVSTCNVVKLFSMFFLGFPVSNFLQVYCCYIGQFRPSHEIFKEHRLYSAYSSIYSSLRIGSYQDVFITPVCPNVLGIIL